MGFILFALWINAKSFDVTSIQHIVDRYGYAGVFLGGVISGFNILVPIPIITLFPFFVEIGLQPILTVVIISFGMVIGDLLGYVIGRVGRSTVEVTSPKTIERLNTLRQRYPRGILVLLFIYAAFVPAPNELIVIPLSVLGVQLWKLLPIVVAGNIVFNSLVAFGLWQIAG